MAADTLPRLILTHCLLLLLGVKSESHHGWWIHNWDKQLFPLPLFIHFIQNVQKEQRRADSLFCLWFHVAPLLPGNRVRDKQRGGKTIITMGCVVVKLEKAVNAHMVLTGSTRNSRLCWLELLWPKCFLMTAGVESEKIFGMLGSWLCRSTLVNSVLWLQSTCFFDSLFFKVFLWKTSLYQDLKYKCCI